MTNIVIIEGRLSREPEPIANGKGARLSVAVSKKYKTQSGEWAEKTTWVNVTAWASVQYIMRASKGSRVLIQGDLEENKYTNKEGKEIKNLQVTITPSGLISVLTGLQDKDTASQETSYAQAPAVDDLEDSIPF
jgi:single-strand DNA-binding protein